MHGILAYGSLIANPGTEISENIQEVIDMIETPFTVEFARSSNGRSGAPTLIPVKNGGAYVRANIFVLKHDVSEQEAKDLVYRREIDQVGSDKRYDPPSNPGKNTVLVESINDFAGLSSVVYTKIASNLDDTSPGHLADLAIESAKKEGDTGRDGISYLINAKRNGIATPLMEEYEQEVLQRTGATSLEEARSFLTL